MVFFDGQIFDAYNLIIDFIKRAKRKILIIDNYIDDSILKMLTKKNSNVNVVIITSEKSNIQKIDIQKFNKELYHIGASLKDLGKKCFAISKIEDREYLMKISKLI